MTAPLLSATGLTKVYTSRTGLLGRTVNETRAVDDVDLDVGRGETLAVVGESGAGKSTVGRLLLRLIEPDAGRVHLDGVDVTALGNRELRSLRRRMQMIFQDPFSSLDPKMVIADAVGAPLALHFGIKGEERRARVLDLLDTVGIGEHQMERYPYEFSGGQLQRIAIARALAVEPDLIVCDEPVAALDVSIQAQVINLLADLQGERGVSYVFISHDLSLVRVIADRVAVMYQGQVVEVGESSALFTNPRHPYTRALLAVIPVPDPRRRAQRASVARRLSRADPPRVSTGCAYAARCPIAEDVCWTTRPDLRPLDDDTQLRCHLVEPVTVAIRQSAAS